MNISSWSRGKKLLVIFLVLFFFVGVGVTVYLVQRQQDIRSQAQKATVITLSPPNQSAAVGGSAQEDVTINPGTNQVNFVKVTISFDSSVFDADSVTFDTDPNSPLQPVGDVKVVSDSKVSIALQVGADPTKVVQTTTTLGAFTLPVKSDASTGETDLTIDKQATQVRSVGGNDAFNENVLDSVVNAKVTITGGQCIPNQSTCEWDASAGATSYRYIITADNQSNSVAEGTTTDTSVTFTSTPGVKYTCGVTVTNECGTSDQTQGENTCSVTPTPTLSVTPTLTPTPSVTLTPTPSTTTTPTPTGTTTVTPTTPQTFNTATPVPTTIIAQGPTETPQPTLPPTGNPVVIGGILGGLLFVLGGLALLFL